MTYDDFYGEVYKTKQNPPEFQITFPLAPGNFLATKLPSCD